MRIRCSTFRVAAAAAAAITVSGCGHGTAVPAAPIESATAADVALVAGIPASALPDPGSPGARLVGRYCGQCHDVPSPARLGADEWGPTLRRMYLRMDRMATMRAMGRGMMGRGRMRGRGMREVAAPTAAERDTILAYLASHALRAAPEGGLPERGGEGADVFRRACSRCHALPDPRQHAPAEWGAVVVRMRGHMRDMRVGDVTDAEARAIVGYLSRAAASPGR